MRCKPRVLHIRTTAFSRKVTQWRPKRRRPNPPSIPGDGLIIRRSINWFTQRAARRQIHPPFTSAIETDLFSRCFAHDVSEHKFWRPFMIVWGLAAALGESGPERDALVRPMW